MRRTRTYPHQSKKSITHIRQYRPPRAFTRTHISAEHTKHRTQKRCLKKKAGILGDDACSAFMEVCKWLLNKQYYLIEEGICNNRYFFFKTDTDKDVYIFEAVHQSVNDNKTEEFPQPSVVKAPPTTGKKEKQLSDITIPQFVLRNLCVNKVVNDSKATEELRKVCTNIKTHVFEKQIANTQIANTPMSTFTINIIMHDRLKYNKEINIMNTRAKNINNHKDILNKIKFNLQNREHPETQAIIDYLNYEKTDFYVKFDVKSDVNDKEGQILPGIILSEIDYKNSLFSKLNPSIPTSLIDLANLKHLMCSVMFFYVGKTAIYSASNKAKTEKAIMSGLVTLKILIKTFAPIPDFKPLIDELYRQYEETAKKHMEADMEAYFTDDLLDNAKEETENQTENQTDKTTETVQCTVNKQPDASDLPKKKWLEITELLVGERSVPSLNEKMSPQAILDVINKWVCSPSNLNSILSKMFKIPNGFTRNIYPQTFDVQGCANSLQVVALVKVHKSTVVRTVFQAKKKSLTSHVTDVIKRRISTQKSKSIRQEQGDTVQTTVGKEPTNATEKAHSSEQPKTNPRNMEIINERFQLETANLHEDASGMYTFFMVLYISKSIDLTRKIINKLVPFVDGGAIRGAIIHPDLLKVYSLRKFGQKQKDVTEKIYPPIYCRSKKMANSIIFDFKLTEHDQLLQALKEKIDSQEETIKNLQEKINPSTQTSA